LEFVTLAVGVQWHEAVSSSGGATPLRHHCNTIVTRALPCDVEATIVWLGAECAVVLVAGGVGERLGYRGIKVRLPCETTTSTSYLELYISNILALQVRCRRDTHAHCARLRGDASVYRRAAPERPGE
jgi:hypothetical protein